MRYGDEITFLRSYDGGRFRPGQAVEVGGGPDKLRPGVAESLCRPAADGQGPYAEPVTEDVPSGDTE